MATKRERLDELYRRLSSTPRASTADAALEELCRMLEQVEDQLSGIPKKVPPPELNMPDGRMYAPEADCISRHADGRITAKTQGHIIELGPDGSVAIRQKSTGSLEFHK
jgi:hypothetical protein